MTVHHFLSYCIMLFFIFVNLYFCVGCVEIYLQNLCKLLFVIGLQAIEEEGGDPEYIEIPVSVESSTRKNAKVKGESADVEFAVNNDALMWSLKVVADVQ